MVIALPVFKDVDAYSVLLLSDDLVELDQAIAYCDRRKASSIAVSTIAAALQVIDLVADIETIVASSSVDQQQLRSVIDAARKKFPACRVAIADANATLLQRLSIVGKFYL